MVFKIVLYQNRQQMSSQLSKKIDSIFQININESKLSKLFQSLFAQIQLFNKKLKSNDERLDECEKMKQDIIDFTVEDIRTQTGKIMKLVNEKESNLMNLLNNLVNSKVGDLEIKLLETYQKESSNYVSSLDKTKEQIEKLQSIIYNQNLEISEYKESISKRIQTLEHYCEETGRRAHLLLEEGESKFQIINSELSDIKSMIQPEGSQKISIDKKKFRGKKSSMTANGVRQINKIKTIEYASIAKKIDHIEQRLNENDNKPLNIIAYPNKISKNNEKIRFNSSRNDPNTHLAQAQHNLYHQSITNLGSYFDKEDAYQTEEKQLLVKKQIVQNIIFEKLNAITAGHDYKTDKIFQGVQLKIDILDEKFQEMRRKVNKLHHMQAEFKLKSEEIDKIRIQNSMIAQISMNFKKIKESLNAEEMRYAPKESLAKQIQKVTKKIMPLEILIEEKANKQEIKRAFMFIESKIKEIVVIISSNFSKQKNSAITRTQPIRCLTCDKEDSYYEEEKENKESTLLGFKQCKSMRGLTGKLRKTIKCVYSKTYVATEQAQPGI